MNAPDLLAALHPLLQRLQRVDIDDPREADALNAEDWDGAREQLMRWVRGGGRVLPGLVRRRQAEAALL